MFNVTLVTLGLRWPTFEQLPKEVQNDSIDLSPFEWNFDLDKSSEKRQTSQGYSIRILQHFGTKLRNITNFVMLFQAVMKLLPRHI
jgi:hypothetical protein